MLFSVIMSTGIIIYLTYYLLTEGIGTNSDFYLAPLSLLGVMVFVIFVINGVYIIKNYKIKRARSWPSLIGRIQSVTRDNSGYRIRYSYTYEDRNYYNDQFDLTRSRASKGILKMFPEFRDASSVDDLPGRMVKVYFNPDNISEAVISTRLEQNPWLIFIPAYTVIGICFYYIIMLIHSIFSLSGLI